MDLSTFGLKPGYTIASIGHGLIHDTSIILYDRTPEYVLQHLNTTVFPDPELLANNAKVVTDRIREAVQARGGDETREVLNFVPAKDGRYFARDTDGTFYRLSQYVSNSMTVDVAATASEAASITRAFASFTNDLWDVPAERVTDAIPGFHDTPSRYRRLLEVVETARTANPDRLADAIDIVDAVSARADNLGTIESKRREGKLTTHVCHNDTKVNNVLLDADTREPLCVIDFDTVGRGSPLMDLGDLLRTAAASVSEEEQDHTKVSVVPEFASAIVGAFGDVLSDRLNNREKQLLTLSGWVITIEQCIRYLADFLEGDIYYGERYPGQNLFKARNQLALAVSMENEFVELP